MTESDLCNKLFFYFWQNKKTFSKTRRQYKIGTTFNPLPGPYSNQHHPVSGTPSPTPQERLLHYKCVMSVYLFYDLYGRKSVHDQFLDTVYEPWKFEKFSENASHSSLLRSCCSNIFLHPLCVPSIFPSTIRIARHGKSFDAGNLFFNFESLLFGD